MIEVLDMNTMINTDYVQSVDKIDDNQIMIMMADGREYIKDGTFEDAMKWFLSSAQHPKSVQKVEIINNKLFTKST